MARGGQRLPLAVSEYNSRCMDERTSNQRRPRRACDVSALLRFSSLTWVCDRH